jgi:predicted alpha/beta superfamily hydrolase
MVDVKMLVFDFWVAMYKFILIVVFVSLSSFAQTLSIGERVSIDSDVLDDKRQILIYFPPSYHVNKAEKYPVLYMVDADYNFHYVTGLIELLSSISENIPEMLVVGLSGKGTATYRKQSKPPYDVKDKGTADVTLDFFEQELMPYINQHYKTNGYDVLAGHSIGGLFSTYALLNNHQLFDAFIAISPSLWWEDEAIKRVTQEKFKQKQQIPSQYYITLANEKGMGVHGFVELLQSKGPRSLNLHFKHFPEESHGSVGLPSYRWALQDLFKDFRIEEKYFKDALAVKDYYQLNQQKYKTSFHISAGFLRNTVYHYSKDKQARRSIEKALAEYFPLQLDEFRNIQITALIGVGKLQEADEILTRAIKNDKNNFETLANQAMLLQKKNKPKKALTLIEQAIKLAQQKKIRQWLMNELIEQRAGLILVQ